jgi:aspartate dehydrogenase
MKKLRIGIVGCGAIGTSLAKAITKDFSGQADLVALYDTDVLKARRLSGMLSKNKGLAVNNLEQLINRVKLVIESASAAVSWDIAKNALVKGRDVMLMSVGGVVSRLDKLRELAKRRHCRVYIPSGAISGIDALKAAKLGRIRKVTLTTRKNPISFKGVKYIEKKRIRLDKIKKDEVLFSGTAKEAVRYFPQNINVAAVLSLGGIGENKTKVEIIASPKTNKNIHEIYIESKAARILTRTENIVHPDNPKTSYLAVLSAIATLKQILEPVKIGT